MNYVYCIIAMFIGFILAYIPGIESRIKPEVLAAVTWMIALIVLLRGL